MPTSDSRARRSRGACVAAAFPAGIYTCCPTRRFAFLVGDAFFNVADTRNTLWTVSLSHFVPGGLALPAVLTLRVLPLRPDAAGRVARVLRHGDAWPAFYGTGPGGTALALDSVEVLCTATTVLHATA